MNTFNVHLDLTGNGWEEHCPHCVISVNNEIKFDGIIKGDRTINFDVEYINYQTYTIKVWLANKTADDTCVIDGNIVNDVILSINSVLVNNIDVYGILYDIATYNHSYNREEPTTPHKYTGVMGCNGYCSFNISTPVQYWLMENLQ